MDEHIKRFKEDVIYCSKDCYLSHNKTIKIDFIYPTKEETIFLEKISESFSINPCICYLSLKYRFNSSYTCQELDKYIIRANLKIKKFVYKECPIPTRKKYMPIHIYQPCSHLGACNQNPKCSCYESKSYCEIYCLCQCCNNVTKCSCLMCDSSCPCYQLSRECTSLCHTNCKNKPIQNKIEKLTLIKESTKSGYGLFAGEDIESDEFVIEYTGEFISNDEADKRGFFYDLKKISYLFDVIRESTDGNTTIDATRIGNNSRFVNHGKDNEINIVTRPVMVDGQLKMCMFAAKKIKNGEELYFDYQYSCDKKETHNIY